MNTDSGLRKNTLGLFLWSFLRRGSLAADRRGGRLAGGDYFWQWRGIPGVFIFSRVLF